MTRTSVPSICCQDLQKFSLGVQRFGLVFWCTNFDESPVISKVYQTFVLNFADVVTWLNLYFHSFGCLCFEKCCLGKSEAWFSFVGADV